MKKKYFILIFSVGFLLYSIFDAAFFGTIQRRIANLTNSNAAGHILAYAVTVFLLYVTVAIMHRSRQNVFEKLGLSGNLFVGLLFAFIVTLPSLIGYGLKFNINAKLSIDTILINTISSAFFEEIIYRAFLIGQLYRYTRLGFFPSLITGSVLFGLVHLYQSNDPAELMGIFLVTFLASLLFFWIYAEWTFNLWTVIFLHCLMNLYWLIFDVDNNALGGTYANVFRFATVALSIIATIIYKRKMEIPFEITRKTWWFKWKNSL
jgi:membrane protease YdiL (CAAX protease family)